MHPKRGFQPSTLRLSPRRLYAMECSACALCARCFRALTAPLSVALQRAPEWRRVEDVVVAFLRSSGEAQTFDAVLGAVAGAEVRIRSTPCANQTPF